MALIHQPSQPWSPSSSDEVDLTGGGAAVTMSLSSLSQLVGGARAGMRATTVAQRKKSGGKKKKSGGKKKKSGGKKSGGKKKCEKLCKKSYTRKAHNIKCPMYPDTAYARKCS